MRARCFGRKIWLEGVEVRQPVRANVSARVHLRAQGEKTCEAKVRAAQFFRRRVGSASGLPAHSRPPTASDLAAPTRRNTAANTCSLGLSRRHRMNMNETDEQDNCCVRPDAMRRHFPALEWPGRWADGIMVNQAQRFAIFPWKQRQNESNNCDAKVSS